MSKNHGIAIYRMETYGADGHMINDGQRVRSPLSNDTDREVQFMEVAFANPAVRSYSIRNLRPNEISVMLKAERKAVRSARRRKAIMDIAGPKILPRISSSIEDLAAIHGYPREDGLVLANLAD